MNIRQISFKGNSIQPEQKESSGQTPVVVPADKFESSVKNKNDNVNNDNVKRYIVPILGIIAGIALIAKHRSIGEALGKFFGKEEKVVSNVNASEIKTQAEGQSVDEVLDEALSNASKNEKMSKAETEPSWDTPEYPHFEPESEADVIDYSEFEKGLDQYVPEAFAKPDDIKPSFENSISLPKFISEKTVGSKEYFDERRSFLHQTGLEAALGGDENAFIGFLDMFDDLNKVTKSSNNGTVTEFGDVLTSLTKFKDSRRSDKLLNRFLDTYHNQVENFGRNSKNSSHRSTGCLDYFAREYGDVASKDTILKLLKEFERTGSNEYIQVRKLGEPFVMKTYFSHFTPAEQKAITAESNNVSKVLEQRAKKVAVLVESK